MKGLLKFITCGSVDDGKSTLIGHILYDAKLLYADQEKALELDSKLGSREGAIDYSLLLDGLMAEREQGITIDVAYRYFTTNHRSFIVADTPGHEQYTRNMAVGASFAELAIILVDAAQGVLVQTKRHARICSLMGIRHFVFAVNKMDLIEYSYPRFQQIEQQIQELVTELALENVKIIPVSATEGDNITKRSDNITWYKGEELLTYLEHIDVEITEEEIGFYMPVQRVCRPNHTFRGFQGQIETGSLSVGDKITTLPSNEQAHVKSIHIGDKEVTSAHKGQPVTIQLDIEVDVSKGCVLEKDAHLTTTNHLMATILWMDDSNLTPGKNFLIKIGTKMIPGIVQQIEYKIDVNSGEHQLDNQLMKNEIALCSILLSENIVVDEFNHHKTLGELILIDRVSNMTSACGVVDSVVSSKDNDNTSELKVTRELRARQKGQKPMTLYFAVNVDSEDSVENNCVDLASEIEKRLIVAGKHTMLLEMSHYQDIGKYARLLNDAGIIALITGSSLAEEEKTEIEELVGSDFFLDLYLENQENVDVDKLMGVVLKSIKQSHQLYEAEYQI